jgi:hypothetical protein
MTKNCSISCEKRYFHWRVKRKLLNLKPILVDEN